MLSVFFPSMQNSLSLALFPFHVLEMRFDHALASGNNFWFRWSNFSIQIPAVSSFFPCPTKFDTMSVNCNYGSVD